MNTRPRLRVLALAIAALSCSMGAAQAVEYQFHQRVKGIVRAAPVAPPAPTCLNPHEQAVGTASSEFCGFLGKSLIKTDASLLFEADYQPRSPWATNHCSGRVWPSRSEIKTAMSVPGANFRVDHHWTREQYSSKYGYLVILQSSGKTLESYSSKGNLFQLRCAWRY